MHGPSYIVWANLTPFLLQWKKKAGVARAQRDAQYEVAVMIGFGRIFALYHRSSTSSTIFTNIFGTSISDATMRPNPR
jgi:hypothetical protein